MQNSELIFMSKQFIITIGRQLGSGGRCIANLLAEHYGITAYDRKVIEMAAQESGLSAEFFENADEKKLEAVFEEAGQLISAARRLCEKSGMKKYTPIERHPLYSTRPARVTTTIQPTLKVGNTITASR